MVVLSPLALPHPPLSSPLQAAGEENASAEEGPWRLTLDMPSYLPCMQHLKNREVRVAASPTCHSPSFVFFFDHGYL